MSSNSVTSTAREHVFPLFVKYVSANVLGMIGYSCYILADTFFVARGIGSDAIAALNLVLPAFLACLQIGKHQIGAKLL